MSKKAKVIVSLLIAILLMVAIPATMVMGQEDEDEPTPALQLRVRDAVLDKVAEILGISAEDLVAAFEQAREEQREQIHNQATDNRSAYPEFTEKFRERWAEKQEMWQEKRGQALERAREKGYISEDEANEIRSWWGQRPESLNGFAPGARIGNAMRGRHMFTVPRGWHGPIPSQPAE